MDRNPTSEISCHLFVQAVELLPVFEPGGVWHGPVAGTSHHGRHQRRRRGGRARRQTVKVDIPVNKLVTADFLIVDIFLWTLPARSEV